MIEDPRNAHHIEGLLLKLIRRGGNLRKLMEGMAVVTSDGNICEGSSDGRKLTVEPHDLLRFDQFWSHMVAATTQPRVQADAAKPAVVVEDARGRHQVEPGSASSLAASVSADQLIGTLPLAEQKCSPVAIGYSKDYYSKIVQTLGHQPKPDQMVMTRRGPMAIEDIFKMEGRALQDIFPITLIE